jgi:hypothetical protein
MADHDLDEIDDDVEPSRERVPWSPRLLIVTLSVGCVALAISNIALATRVTQMRRATVADRPAVARGPIESSPAASEQASPDPASPAASTQTAPRVSRAPDVPPPTAPRVASAPEAAPAPMSIPSVPERETTPVAAAPEAVRPERPAAELPPRSAPRGQQHIASVQRTGERVMPGPSTPERATASWMVHEYGRVDAEARARTVADFYGAHSAEGAYWRRVLREIVTARR